MIVDGDILNLDNTTFIQNKCDVGAIELKGKGSTFLEVEKRGTRGDSQYAIVNSLFQENSSPGIGFLVFSTIMEPNFVLNVTNCEFVSNKAAEGGAIDIATVPCYTTLENNYFFNNSAIIGGITQAEMYVKIKALCTIEAPIFWKQ